MEKLFDFTNKTQGRDKIYRTVQYTCKLVGWGLKETNSHLNIAKKLGTLESQASTARKFLRLGKSLESLRSAQNTIHLLDPVLKYTLTITHLNRALFLLVDHYLWLGRVGLTDVHKKWEYMSARFYLATIILSVVRDLYAFYLAYLRQSKVLRMDESSKQPLLATLLKCFHNNPEAALDLIRNLSDFPIPGAKLGYFPNHNGLIGFFGLTSSIIGAYQVAYPYMKLRP